MYIFGEDVKLSKLYKNVEVVCDLVFKIRLFGMNGTKPRAHEKLI